MFCLKTREKGLWVIFFYTIASLLADFAVSSKWGTQNTIRIWNLYTVVEFTILSLFFYIVVNVRSLRVLLTLFVIIFYSIFFIQIGKITIQYNSVLSFFSQAIILVLCLTYLFTGMKNNAQAIDILNPIFIAVVALLLYVASTLFLFIIANKLSEKEMNEYWSSITQYSNILTNVLFSIAFLLDRFQHKPTPIENHPVDFTSANDR